MGGLGCGPCRGGEELATSTAPASMRYMHLGMGHDPAHAHYKGNTTSTAKYNAFTFLPKCLFEQYRRIANIYFTLVAFLSLTPYSPVRPWTTFLPLAVVLGVSMIKEGIEDYKRHRQDWQINNRKVEVLNSETGVFEERKWADVVVGDVLCVAKDEAFPADLLFLTAETPEGICYIETMNLDGETNLKIKKAMDLTLGYRAETLRTFEMWLQCEGPNSRLHTFLGNLLARPQQLTAATTSGGGGGGGMTATATAGGGGLHHHRHSRQLSVGDGGLLMFSPTSVTTPSLQQQQQQQHYQQPYSSQQLLHASQHPSPVQLRGYTGVGPLGEATEPLGVSPSPLTLPLTPLTLLPPPTPGPASGQLSPTSLSPSGGGVLAATGRRATASQSLMGSMLRGMLSPGGGGGGGGGAHPAELGVPLDAVKVPVNPASVLLRGCSLRNTPRIYGAVLYAGHETKVFMNSTKAPSKRSRVERTIDKIIICTFSLLLSFCIIGAVVFSVWTQRRAPRHWYIRPEKPNGEEQYDPSRPASVAGASFITSFILYGYLIPISMYVSVEIVKILQMGLVNSDRDMYHDETDTPALARTSNLNEELGMVQTILTDKTGTLTRNVMEFFKCSIAGVSYGQGVTEIERSNAERKGIALPPGSNAAAAAHRQPFFNFYDSRLMGPHGRGAWQEQPGADTIQMFFRLLSVCHTVIPDGSLDPSGPSGGRVKYEAESPDEQALVVAAKALGFYFHRRSNTTVTVREAAPDGSGAYKDVTYELLNTLEFNSTRKRMSVIVKAPGGRLLLFCKGADSVIYARLDPRRPDNLALKDITSRHMEEYGSAGLRTLCLAYSELDPAVYAQWQVKYMEAKTSLEDRERKLDEVYEAIESGLTLLGATAIEDKLQDGVPGTIEMLKQAGIRIWVLTGDKVETAVNIGYACSLITDHMVQFQVSASTEDIGALEKEATRAADEAGMDAEERAAQEERLQAMVCELVEQQLAAVQRAIDNDKIAGQEFALIIDGKALSYALSNRLAATFMSVALRCSSVLCCRVSPLQKAQVTQMVKSTGDTTLAIGDGANDVGMIQKAHIGVGISGQEGMQAVLASDFAIAQFRFLQPLLLVHGRWNYKRIARMVTFFFYKNILFGLTIFAYNVLNNFSGQFLYYDFYMSLYNLIFTALMPLAIGIFDRDVPRAACFQFPVLYRQGQRNTHFSFWAIAGWILAGVHQAAILFAFVMLATRPVFADRGQGSTWSQWPVGVLMFSCVIITVHAQMTQVLESWTWVHHGAVWVTLAAWPVFLLVYGELPTSTSGDLRRLFVGVIASCPNFWLCIPVTVLATILPTSFLLQAKRLVAPDDHQIVAEHLKVAERRRRQEDGTADSEADANVVMRIFSHENAEARNNLFGSVSGAFAPTAAAAAAAAAATTPLLRSKSAVPEVSGAPAVAYRSVGPRFLEASLINNPFRYKRGGREAGLSAATATTGGGPGSPMLLGLAATGHLGATTASVSPSGGSLSTLPALPGQVITTLSGTAGGGAGAASHRHGASSSGGGGVSDPQSLDLYVSALS